MKKARPLKNKKSCLVKIIKGIRKKRIRFSLAMNKRQRTKQPFLTFTWIQEKRTGRGESHTQPHSNSKTRAEAQSVYVCKLCVTPHLTSHPNKKSFFVLTCLGHVLPCIVYKRCINNIKPSCPLIHQSQYTAKSLLVFLPSVTCFYPITHRPAQHPCII